MKLTITVLSIVFATGISCKTAKRIQTPATTQFLSKSKIDTSRHHYGQHLELKFIFPPDAKPGVFYTLGNEDGFSAWYSKKQKKQILEEYLTFNGDTTKSDKQYYFFKYTYPQDREHFTIQIEALFSFTRMFVRGYPPLQPKLIDKNTGIVLNNDQSAIDEIYLIYKRWLQSNIRNDFNDFALPLENTRYQWVGQSVEMKEYTSNRWWKQTVQIKSKKR
jgi:hypothetical protein